MRGVVNTASGETFVDVMFRVKKGGRLTFCAVEIREPRGLAMRGEGVSKCHERDRVNKVIGKAKAMSRALTNVFASKPIRLAAWKRFDEVFGGHPDFLALSGRNAGRKSANSIAVWPTAKQLARVPINPPRDCKECDCPTCGDVRKTMENLVADREAHAASLVGREDVE